MPKGKAAGKKPEKKPSASKMAKKDKPAKGGIKKGASSQDGEKRKNRFKPGTVALREIRRYQQSTNHMIPRAPFARLVRFICQENFNNNDLRFSSKSLSALQEAAEAYLTGLFEDANMCCLHAKRLTL